ncbi:MAG: hypothetical protein ACPGJV_10425 [Bacteriovoracaceae bacterium]
MINTILFSVLFLFLFSCSNHKIQSIRGPSSVVDIDNCLKEIANSFSRELRWFSAEKPKDILKVVEKDWIQKATTGSSTLYHVHPEKVTVSLEVQKNWESFLKERAPELVESDNTNIYKLLTSEPEKSLKLLTDWFESGLYRFS